MTAFDAACQAVEPGVKHGETGAFWRREDPEFDAAYRIIRGGMFDHQREWWDLLNFYKVLVGGYGSGKTFIGCKRIVASALTNAPCPVAVVSPTYGVARYTVIATIRELLDGKRRNYGRRFWYRYNKTDHVFKIRFKGRDAMIIIYSGEDPQALIGPNLATAYLDEPFVMDKGVFTQMIARVRHPQAVRREIFMTGTPEQLNWGYDIIFGEEQGQHDVGFVQASTRANVALDPDYVKRLEGAFTGKAAQAYIEGGFINLAEGQVYYGFDPNIHVQDLDIPKNAEIGVGMDFNVNPMAFCAFWVAGSHMHFFDEWELPNADTEYACSVLNEMFNDEEDEYGTPIRRLKYVYPDATGSARKTSAPAGRTDFHYIKQAGFEVRAPNANPKRRDRYNAVNGKLRPKIGKPTITIGPRCRKLKKYLSQYTHEQMNRQQAMSHLLDAFGYPVAHLFPVAKETLSVERLRGV